MGAGVAKTPPDTSRISSPVDSSANCNNDMSSCEACSIRFSLLKRKKACSECMKHHCSGCLTKSQATNGPRRRCQKCQLLVSGRFTRADLMDYKAKELRQFLMRRDVAITNCTEKADLVEALLRFNNSSQYRLEQDENNRRIQQLQQQRDQLQQEQQQQREREERQQQQQQQDRPPPSPTQRPAGDAPRQDGEGTPHSTPRSSTGSHRNFQPPSYDDVMAAGARAGAATTTTTGTTTTTTTTASGTTTTAAASATAASATAASATAASGPTTAAAAAEPSSSSSSDDEGAPNVAEGTSSTPTSKTKTTPAAGARQRVRIEHISNLKEINDLTVLQLKEVLANSYVDYKGCVEKWELRERVLRLFNDTEENKRRAEELEKEEQQGREGGGGGGGNGDADLCKICMEGVIDCVLLECGHMVTCTSCGKQMSECPICRQYVVRVVHVFK